MPLFRNLWTEDNAAVHRCDDCGQLVIGLSGIMEHVCYVAKEESDQFLESMADLRLDQIDGKGGDGGQAE